MLWPIAKAGPVPLTVNGHLLSTESLDQQEHQVIFQRIGEYATDVEFHHVHIPVPLGLQIQIADQAMELINKYAHNIHQETLMHYHKDNYYQDDAKAEAYATLLTHQNQFITNSSAQILNQIKKQILSVTAALPQSPANHRMARQLGFIFGLVGTAFATANAIRISNIENQNLQNQRELHILTHIAEIQEKHLDHLDLKVMANEQQTLEALRYNPALLASTANTLVFQTTDVARVVSATVQQAQMNRLSTDLLQGETINKMFNFLDTAAKQKGMQLMIKKSVDLFQTELSYFYHPEDKTLNLFLHVPMVHPKNLLQFFQLVPFPIANSIKSNTSMMPNVKEDLIAVGAEHQFQLVTETDRQACQIYGTTYLCSGRHTTRTDLDDTCLGAYYLENWKAVNKLCQFDFIPAKEHVYKMSSNKWIISSPTPFSTTIQCNKVFSTINLKALSIVTVPAGCTMHLKTHNIHPGSSISDTSMEVKHFQWKWDPAQMFPNFNTKAFNNTMNSLKETGAISIDYINHEVRQKLNNDKESEDSAKDLIQELKEENHVHPNILLYIVIIVIIIGLTCAFVYIVMNKNNIRPYILYKRRQLTQVPIASNVEAKTRFKDTAFELHNLAESNIYPKLTPLTSSVPV